MYFKSPIFDLFMREYRNYAYLGFQLFCGNNRHFYTTTKLTFLTHFICHQKIWQKGHTRSPPRELPSKTHTSSDRHKYIFLEIKVRCPDRSFDRPFFSSQQIYFCLFKF